MASPFSAYLLSKDEVFSRLSTQETGLSSAEAHKRLVQYGLNTLTSKKKISALSIFLGQFRNVLTLILIGSAFLILFIYFFGDHDPSDLIEAGLIFAIILIITVLGFLQEYKAERAIESLKKLLAFKAHVKRDGAEIEIDVSSLVPGDIVFLEEGEKIPADIRLLKVTSLTVNESSLTGESVPVRKIDAVLSGIKQISDQKNMVFSGTSIASGRGLGVVVSTGDTTEIGKIAGLVADAEDEETPIQKKLDQIGKMIGYVILFICVVMFIFIMFFAKDFASLPFLSKLIHSFIASVALAVAAIPEGLPAVVTITLALGTQRMLAKNALVRKLNSIETLGSTDVICSDKTGTLTKGEMTVKEVFWENSIYSVSGSGYESSGEFSQNDKKIDPSSLRLLFEAGLYCNNARFGENTLLGDPTEGALIISALKAGVVSTFQRVLELPFSSERKKMSVVVTADKKYIVYLKGAPEIVLKNCQTLLKKGKEAPLTPSEQKEILNATLDMSSKALRVLAFAYKVVSQKEAEAYKTHEEETEKDLVFLGLQGMIDPARQEVAPLISECQKSGIRVIMITGDHAATAMAVGKAIGITGEALSGEELDVLSPEELRKKVESVSIYARVNPSHKMKIVDSLKQNGHIVAMTGDGVNDAPALKRADIGIAMGITGTDVAKEASDMVLLDDLFSTIISAVQEGRGIFHNIRKFVTYLLACNIGEVLVVFFAVVLFQEVPLTATMLLWINVITDGLPAVALGLDPAAPGIMRYSPKNFQSEIITKRLWCEMVIFGILMTIGVLGIYALNLSEGVAEARGASFTAIVLFELVNIFIIRSNFNASFFTNKWLLWAVVMSMILQVAIVYVPFLANLFEVKHIDLADWSYIVIASVFLFLAFKLIRKILDSFPFLEKEKVLQKAE